MLYFDINTDALVVLTSKLELTHKSALPSAVRNTLNDAAIFTKRYTLQQEAKRQFILRKPSFFHAFSWAMKARGFNVGSMSSVVGMTDKNHSSRQLKFQERGGNIRPRGGIPTKYARKSQSHYKTIPKKKQKDQLTRIKATRGKSEKQKFVRAAFRAIKVDKTRTVVQNEDGLFLIKTLRKGRGNKLTLRYEKIYRFKKSDSIRLKPRPFVYPAALRSTRLMHKWFHKNAQFQLNKIR